MSNFIILFSISFAFLHIILFFFFNLQLVLANPKGEVVKKLTRSNFIGEYLGKEWMFLTVGEAVEACSYMLHTFKGEPASEKESWNNV